MEYIVNKQNNSENALTNLIYMNQDDFKQLSEMQNYTLDSKGHLYVELTLSKKSTFKKIVYSAIVDIRIESGYIGLSGPQRENLFVTLGSIVTIGPHENNTYENTISKVSFLIEPLNKNESSILELDMKKLKTKIGKTLNETMLRVGQKLLVVQKRKLVLNVTNIVDMSDTTDRTSGLFMVNMSSIEIETTDKINITGKLSEENKSIFDNGFDFNQLGIGGLDAEFGTIFKRAFASRMFPDNIVKQMGINHVRGMLLFGPPGCGKTLIARQLGKALNSREPKIVNGPEILDSYVGGSEKNVRKLFEDAEKEQKEQGSNSMLHIIIFDEFDAICKKRGAHSSTGVNDQVVNQLLSKIDGIDSLNNVLIIGMTNRKESIDDAILRPGRLEVHVEISLPDQEGRLQILNIHTEEMRNSTNKRMTDDCSGRMEEIAERAENYTGAELTGLVRFATSNAMDRCINKETFKVEAEQLCVNYDDFDLALKEVKPMFGSSNEKLENLYKNGIIDYGTRFKSITTKLERAIERLKISNNISVLSVLLEGVPMTGKTAIAAFISVKSKFPFISFISANDMIGMSEYDKCIHIKEKFTASSKSPYSIIILDDIERIIEYIKIGHRFSSSVVQTLLVLLKNTTNTNKLMILGTTSDSDLLLQLDMRFDLTVEIPELNNVESKIVLRSIFEYSQNDDEDIEHNATFPIKKLIIDSDLEIV